jgi:hypothetical protein
MGISLNMCPAGEPGRKLFYLGLWRWMNRILGMKLSSLNRLKAENLWKGLFYWRPWKIGSGYGHLSP